MKTLRYLLVALVIALASVSAKAQFNQPVDTEYHFRSTSSYGSSGSSLPIAAQSGVVVGSATPDDNVPQYASGNGPRRSRPDDWQEPGLPIGNGICVLLMMAAGYAEYRRRKLQNVTD